MLKRKLIRSINVILFVLTFALLSYTDAVYESKGVSGGLLGNLKYITAFAGIMFCVLQLKSKRERSNYGASIIFSKEAQNVAFAIFAMFCLSILECIIHPFAVGSVSEMLSEFFKLILPIIYAYLLLNTFEFEDIYNSMIFILAFSIIGYVLEVGLNTFTIANIQKINFDTSYSPFESHYASGSAIAMCTFFMYYRKNKILEVISFMFAIATFKRAAVVFAIVCFCLPIIVDMSKKVKKRTVNTIKVLFVIATYVYYQILLPVNESIFEKIFGVDSDSFTMGRSGYIAKLMAQNYKSAGLGSTTVVIGKSIEMDLIKIMFELTIVGLIIFIWCYFECAGRTRYSILYMSFVFFNLLTSHSLTNAFSWILIFTIIGTMNYKESVDLSEYVRQRKRRKLSLR